LCKTFLYCGDGCRACARHACTVETNRCVDGINDGGDGINDFGDGCRACARRACTVGTASMTAGMASMSVGMVAGLVQDMHVLWGWHQ